MLNNLVKKYIMSDSYLESLGVVVNGDRPCDMQVHNEKLYSRVLLRGSVGLGEAYMDKWWDCEKLDEFFTVFLDTSGYGGTHATAYPRAYKVFCLLREYWGSFINMQSRVRSRMVAERHYDLGYGLYEAMLDPSMTYSCGYWKHADTLHQAQIDKLMLVCKKLKLSPGMRVLDIGCGWGGFAEVAAKNFGVSVVGITISKEQAVIARQRCSGLPVEIRVQDYRDLNQSFDRVVSIGMFEHVGHKNYRQFMEVCHRCLKDNDLMLLHTIGHHSSKKQVDSWNAKYIFPNGTLPAIQDIGASAHGLLVIEDLHNFGQYYDRTLMAWYENFIKHWPELSSRYDERFKRMWEYYLLSCAAVFRSNSCHLWQVVLSKNRVGSVYECER